LRRKGKEAARQAALKPGLRIRVTTKRGDNTIATKVEAPDKNKKFGKSESR
jgi:hypothetical protein